MQSFTPIARFREPGPISWAWLSLLTAAAGALRLVNLNSDLWLDEIGTLVSYLRLPLDQIVRTYGSMNQHLLYSLLARISVVWFGEAAWAVRLPAALFGIAAIPALYYTARLMTSEREALLAAALLTFSYHHIWFSQDARGYSAMVFFSLLGTGILIRGITKSARIYWIAYAIVMTLGVVSLQNTLFVVLGHWICCMWLLGLKRSKPMHSSVFSIIVLSLLCHSFMLGAMFQFITHAERTGLGWTNVWDLLPVVTQGLAAGFGLVALVCVGILGTAGWYSFWRQTPFFAGILVIPVILNAGILIVLGIGAYPRSFLYELPFALLIAVRGATELFRRAGGQKMATAVCLLVLGISSFPLVRYYRLPKQDFSGALAYVRAHEGANDVVMGADLAGTVYRRYYFPGIVIATGPSRLRRLNA